jgi:hypothetical protein
VLENKVRRNILGPKTEAKQVYRVVDTFIIPALHLILACKCEEGNET